VSKHDTLGVAGGTGGVHHSTEVLRLGQLGRGRVLVTLQCTQERATRTLGTNVGHCRKKKTKRQRERAGYTYDGFQLSGGQQADTCLIGSLLVGLRHVTHTHNEFQGGTILSHLQHIGNLVLLGNAQGDFRMVQYVLGGIRA